MHISNRDPEQCPDFARHGQACRHLLARSNRCQTLSALEQRVRLALLGGFSMSETRTEHTDKLLSETFGDFRRRMSRTGDIV
eukprot:691883-Heterocapsa_arctica.AAC.1